ncbi:helix-turn-helix domain-containing protein [Nocardia beijingensis]|uniref:helix-turn-helix domain-containing protein n=1 Tax=Nocardia beijingensis TaxID=95162 RepID=UPI00082A4010|nr:helix-turn-helix domain-containing protein [Nocardia beijingensis]
MARSWKDVKADVHAQGLIDPAHVTKAKREIEGAQRAYRLAQVRKAQARTQTEIAEAMGVTQARVSNIERGDMSHTELGTLAAYVRALGGKLRVVAEFGNGDTLALE